MHILAAGCTDVITCAPDVYMFYFYNILIPLCKEARMDKLPGAQFWLPLHPPCAQYKYRILTEGEVTMANSTRGR